jgi:hypothetical protein
MANLERARLPLDSPAIMAGGLGRWLDHLAVFTSAETTGLQLFEQIRHYISNKREKNTNKMVIKIGDNKNDYF